MKKTVFAFSVVAASGLAMAQSSVSLTGNVNLGVVKNTGASAKLDASNGASQIIFKGTEDLGGGLRANFTLAQRLSLESGNNDGTLNQRATFQGESTVGLSGNFGVVKLGRSLTAFQGPSNSTDPWGTLTAGSTANIASGYSTDPRQADGAGAGRTDAITYATPVFGGFSAAFSLGLKRSAAVIPETTGTKNLTSLWLSYAKGPLMVGGGYEKNRREDDVAAILATYDLGVAKLMGGYSQVDTVATAGKKRTNWNLGIAAPVGVVTVKAGYNTSEAEGTGIKSKKAGLGGEYNLSKRTYLYTTYGRTRVGSAGATTGFDLGIRHAF